MMGRAYRLAEEEPAVNLTPLIDVVFVVLIMFIVIAPMLEYDSIDLASSSGLTSQPAQQMSPIAIEIKGDHVIYVNRHPVAEGQVGEALKVLKEHFPTAVPQLYCDTKAPFGMYQLIKNSAEQAGFEQLEVVLKPG